MRETDRTYASFRLLGHALDPAEVTRTIGLEPDFTARKGDPSPRLREPLPTGSWSITSRAALDETTIDLGDHLRFLLDLLLPSADAIGALCQRRDLSADFFCLWMSGWDQGGPEPIAATVLADMGRLAATLTLDIYPQRSNIGRLSR